MKGESLEEFIRRLKEEGLAYVPLGGHIGEISRENGDGVVLDNDGSVLYNPGNKPMAMRVLELYSQVREYMSAFIKAPRDADEVSDTRTLLLYNNCELAATKFSTGEVMFATWMLDRNGERETGHYYNDYADAKQDFTVRAELINRDLLFSEKELEIIRSSLSSYLTLDNAYMSGRQEDAVKGVIGKIDNVIAPEIHENAEEAEELGYEPEREL